MLKAACDFLMPNEAAESMTNEARVSNWLQ